MPCGAAAQGRGGHRVSRCILCAGAGASPSTLGSANRAAGFGVGSFTLRRASLARPQAFFGPAYVNANYEWVASIAALSAEELATLARNSFNARCARGPQLARWWSTQL